MDGQAAHPARVGRRARGQRHREPQLHQNKDFELTLELERNDILDDQYGLFNPVAEEIGRSSRKWPDQQLIKLIKAGTTTLCHDGQNFFDIDHPIDRYTPSLGTRPTSSTSPSTPTTTPPSAPP